MIIYCIYPTITKKINKKAVKQRRGLEKKIYKILFINYYK